MDPADYHAVGVAVGAPPGKIVVQTGQVEARPEDLTFLLDIRYRVLRYSQLILGHEQIVCVVPVLPFGQS